MRLINRIYISYIICMSTINGSRLKLLAMLFLFVPQKSWDLQLRMFGYNTRGFPRIFGYVLQVILKIFHLTPSRPRWFVVDGI